jgi:hypothetical protein
MRWDSGRWRRLWDGWHVKIVDEDTRWYLSASRTELRQYVRCNVVIAPHVPLVQDPPASLEASLAAPPRKPRNPACKRVTKKLKVSETTPQEVRHLE